MWRIALVLGLCAFAVLASVVMARAADRSALWNMGFAVVLLFVLIAALYAVALLITNDAVYR
jgi:hypothetical protein